MLMLFEPNSWNEPQDLIVYAIEDRVNTLSPYPVSFDMILTSQDINFNEHPVPTYNLTVEDNDSGECVRER